MNKLLKLYDKFFLKFGIAFLLIFTVLYPKLPSIHIIRTWVYIRLEDFFIFVLALAWIIQIFRKKVKFPVGPSIPIISYWLIGFISLIFSLVFIAPYLSNFFPHIAILSWLRRIEYMILFLIAFSTIRSFKDVRDYFVMICLAVLGATIYGYGQHFYLKLWAQFPDFFRQYSFCFPSFQTGNEEFAKGIPLCLPEGARITSTFGGHYDLAAYLVLITPVLLLVSLSLKKWFKKIIIFILFVAGLILLIFTASRVSFASYLVSVVAALILYRKKILIIPILILSIFLLVLFSESTAKRFLSTFRISSIVTTSQGELVGEALPSDLKNKISDTNVVYKAPPPAQDLPQGSGFIGLPQKTKPASTDVAIVKKTLTSEETKKLNLASGSQQISTVSGSFLIQKALVYDISFTTRFQAEWPNAINAFLRNPLLGSGYSTITLATDGDYFRALGETGLLGLISFLVIFLVLGIILKYKIQSITSPLARGMVLGIAGGTIGVLFNAFLIDVFEASKVAENLWIVLGIGTGALLLKSGKQIPYLKSLKSFFTSNILIAVYIISIIISTFSGSIHSFFAADDFTWLKWAASSVIIDIPNYFTDSHNFFYRPLDKTINFFLYMLFSLQPQGYHVFSLLLHFLSSFGVFLFSNKLTKNKLISFFASVIFLLSPAHSENVYWFSTISVTLSTTLIIYALIFYIHFRQAKSKISYSLAILLSILAFLSYELAIVIPLLIILYDVFFVKIKNKKKNVLFYVPFFTLIPIYFYIRNLTNAFSGGGDYSYSVVNFIPNVFGNIFGYLGLFIAGEPFLPLYNFLRVTMRENKIIFVVILLIIVFILIWLFMKYKKSLINLTELKNSKIILFGVIFAIISLLPYIGLGNIAPRYIYLASVGLSISLIFIIKELCNFIGVKLKLSANLIFIILTLSILLISRSILISEADQWKRAGEITEGMLKEIRLNYDQIPPDSNIYIVNTPTRIDNAWVFPVGLDDSLWFIYREALPSIHRVGNLEDTKNQIKKDKTKNNFIFMFDEEYKIIRVKI